MANRGTNSWRRRVGPVLSVVMLFLAPATSALADLPTAPQHHGGDRHDPFMNCAQCHGADLQGEVYGTATAPSCNTCHGDLWSQGNDPPVVDPGGPYTGSVGRPVTFDASATADREERVLLYEWSFGDARSSVFYSLGPRATYVYQGEGTYDATLTVDDGTNPPVVVPFTVTIFDDGAPAAADLWHVTTTTAPPLDYTLTIENHSGALVMIEDDGVNPPTLALGIEMVGVIFWMDIWMDLSGNALWGTGNIYFGNINRQAGTMLGIVFDDSGGVAAFTGTKNP